MLNLMRADIYRMFRGKGIYIAFAFMLMLVGLMVFVFRMAPASGFVYELIEAVPDNYMTGAMGAELAVNGMNNTVFYFLAGIISISIAAFSSGAVKNELTMGISRTKYYISKWILSCVFSVAVMVVTLALFVLFATIVDGFGSWDGIFGETMRIFGLQSLLAIGFSSVCVFLCFVTRRTGAALGLFLAFVLVPTFILAMLDMSFTWAMDMALYDMFFLFGAFARSTYMSGEVVRGVLVAVGYTLVSTVGGIYLFRKAEIK